MKAYQASTSDNGIAGGASPNDFITVDGLSKEKIFERLKECNKGKHGPKATYIKVVVVSFQDTPKGMPQYFALGVHPQNTNEKNQFSLMVLEAFEMSAMKYRNAVLMNDSTDGVACEVQFNKPLTISHLNVGKKYLSMTNSNNKSKNRQGHMVSGISAASIGNFVVDLWMLKVANFAKEFYRIEDWDSSAAGLRLA